MGFDNGGDAIAGEIDEEICESSLGIRMKMNLRLLYQVDSTALHKETLNEHWQHLGNSEADVGEIRSGAMPSSSNIDLE